MVRIFFRWLSLLTLLLILAGTGSAFAEEGQIYTIKKGDTLWDLSKRFIDDPYYWPNVWAKNPEITNPHLIFPGQKIRILDGRLEIIPAYQDAEQPATTGSEEMVEEEALPVPVAGAADVVKIRSTGSGDGFVLTTEQPLGIVVDSVDNRVLLTENDLVFVKMNDPAGVTVGDTYGMFRRGDLIKHPHTGKPVGTMMYNLGYLQVTEITGKTVVAKIGETFREVERGAELFEYTPQRKEITLQRGTTDAPGYIIAGRDEKATMSSNDVIFIDLGSENGMQSGNLFYISRPREVSDELVKQAGDIELPDEVLGAAITIEAKPTTSSALIIKSVNAAFVGDKVSVVTE